MPDHDEIDIATFDYRALTLEQINELKSAAFRRAHEERMEALKSFWHRVGAGARWLWLAPGRAWARHRIRRRWQADIAILRKMNNGALKDIGLTRLDVEALARRRV